MTGCTAACTAALRVGGPAGEDAAPLRVAGVELVVLGFERGDVDRAAEDSIAGNCRPPSSGAVVGAVMVGPEGDRWIETAGPADAPATGSVLTGGCDAPGVPVVDGGGVWESARCTGCTRCVGFVEPVTGVGRIGSLGVTRIGVVLGGDCGAR